MSGKADNIIYQEMSVEVKAFIESVDSECSKRDWRKPGFEKTIDYLRKIGGHAPQLDGFEVVNNFGLYKVINGYDVYSVSKSDDYDKVILYLHGGAYFLNLGIQSAGLCDDLVCRTNIRAYMPVYPLAPQHTYEDAYPMILELYKDMLGENKEIIILGDSAGGGLAQGFIMYLKKLGLPLPKKSILISPWLDATMSNGDVPEYDEKDIFLSAYGLVEAGKLWAGKTDTADYRISPIFGEVTDEVDTLLFVGTDEIMFPDVKLFYDKLKARGCRVKLVCGKGLFHNYPLNTFPESLEALDMMAEFIG